jgi:hypothetical protein
MDEIKYYLQVDKVLGTGKVVFSPPPPPIFCSVYGLLPLRVKGHRIRSANNVRSLFSVVTVVLRYILCSEETTKSRVILPP